MSSLGLRKLATVSLLTLLLLPGCNRKHDGGDFLPSSPAFQEALRIVLAALSIPADGASTVRVEAQISPDADPDKRTVRFHTTLGSWVEPGSTAATGPQIDRQADEEGKAAAFLQSVTTEGVALITVSVLDKDGNALATVNGEVTFSQVVGAIELAVSPQSTFADGISPINLEARISADSPTAWNQVRFGTDFGVFTGASAAAPQELTVNTDAERVARVQLTSVAVGTAMVQATIVQFPTATVSEQVAFDQRNPNAVSIGTSAATVPADGASEISVFADVAPGLAANEVTFTTTAGTFVPGGGTEVKAATDASGRATVRLRASTDIKEVLLKATIALDADNNQSSDLLIDFVRALPDFIQVSASPSPADQITDGGMTTITVELTRDIGEVSPSTVVDYTVSESDGSAITDMEFTSVERSSAVGGVQTSTAVLDFSLATLPVGGKSVIVEASVAGSGATPASVSILLTD